MQVGCVASFWVSEAAMDTRNLRSIFGQGKSNLMEVPLVLKLSHLEHSTQYPNCKGKFFRSLKLDTVLEYSIQVSQWKDYSASRRKFTCAIEGALAFVGVSGQRINQSQDYQCCAGKAKILKKQEVKHIQGHTSPYKLLSDT
ncbi:hypothetical protein EK904_003052 [Melospiza melodia maxima]|nr:hypothetical protein EK904_003052 [Melospiza melodia maxima]